ncbi:MAG: hypothetical protein CMM47_04475 [Rhodospirillaceae bacterium]|nr:hypothetical protein [Rhodospirillaceae bacterium]
MSTSDFVDIEFNGRSVTARKGETVASALIGAGFRVLRTSENGANRGIFCGMGVCQDCLVEIDGKSNLRACMTKIDGPISVRRQQSGRRTARYTLARPAIAVQDVQVEIPEILVIGAGPAGLSAAMAARRSGAGVKVLDERSNAGGQFYKQVTVSGPDFPPADQQHRDGATLFEKCVDLDVQFEFETTVWGGFENREFIASNRAGTVRYNPQRVIIATGAYERAHVVPGWTLPGVMTTGAAQTLWRSSRRLAGQRVVVAGNGPLNLQLATELTDGGAEVVALVEAARPNRLGAVVDVGRMFLSSREFLIQGIGFIRRLKAAGVNLLNDHVVAGIEATSSGLRVKLTGSNQRTSLQTLEFDTDVVCLGYGFEPSNELARAVGCEQDYDPVRQELKLRLDDVGGTTVQSVYAVGDCAGMGGAMVALSQGEIAGYAAGQSLGYPLSNDHRSRLGMARRTMARQRRFQRALWRIYEYPRVNLEHAKPETAFCRCEEVSVGSVLSALDNGCVSTGEVKRRTRLGMGRCQGRYCVPVLQHIMANRAGTTVDSNSGFAPRVPVKPVAIEDLLRSMSNE